MWLFQASLNPMLLCHSVTLRSSIIHDSHEIVILEFPTSDCSQNEAWCHVKRTDVTVPIENTRRQPNQHCKFNALVARIDDRSIVFNYAVWARCHHIVLNWPAILSERFVWCLKMTFNTRYRWKFHSVTTEKVPTKYRSLKMLDASLGKCSIFVDWGSMAWTGQRLSVHMGRKSA